MSFFFIYFFTHLDFKPIKHNICISFKIVFNWNLLEFCLMVAIIGSKEFNLQFCQFFPTRIKLVCIRFNFVKICSALHFTMIFLKILQRSAFYDDFPKNLQRASFYDDYLLVSVAKGSHRQVLDKILYKRSPIKLLYKKF